MYIVMGKFCQLLNHRHWHNNTCVISQMTCARARMINFKGKIDFEYFNNLISKPQI